MTMTDLLRAARSAITSTVDSGDSGEPGHIGNDDAAPLAWPAVHAERQALLSERQARISDEAGPRVAALEAQLEALKLALKSAQENWQVALGRLDYECAAARSEHTAAIRAECDGAIAPLVNAWCTEPTRATALALIELLPTLAQRVFDVSDYPGNEIVGPCIARAFAAATGIEPSNVAGVARQGDELAKQVLTLAYRKDVTAFERVLRELESALRAVDADQREQRAYGNVTRNYMHAR